MQNLYCRNLLNVKFPKIVAEKFAFYSYAWKYLKVQAHVDVRSMRYQYFYEDGLGRHQYDSDKIVYSSEDSDCTSLDPCFGLKASFYFNTGYRKLKR